MKKKLLAVAVAGALTAPVAAFAQSSVTITGFFKGGFESLKYSNSAKANQSQIGVVDDSSRLIFNVREDLGGGLAAIGQIDMRFGLDSGALAANGNTHVGLQSKTWGRIFVGRQDLHYFGRESDLTAKGSLRADSISILSHAGGGGVAIANASRTPNVVHYTTPNWNGFSMVVAFSSQPVTAAAGLAAEADIGSGRRKGRAWNLAPVYAANNWTVGYSYWNSKQDLGGNTVATGDQRADRLFASYKFPMGLKIGFAWDKTKIEGALDGIEYGDRAAWSIPVSYTWGNHEIHAHFDKARNDKATVADDAAEMFAIAYAYNLSKRTSAALTYARINNKVAGAYTFFTSASLGLGAGASAVAAGEDPRMWAVTLRHAF